MGVVSIPSAAATGAARIASALVASDFAASICARTSAEARSAAAAAAPAAASISSMVLDGGGDFDDARARVSGWVGVDVSTDTSSIARVERTRISPFVAFAVVAASRRAAAFAAARAFRLSRGVVVAAVLVDSESEVWYPTSDPRRSRSSAEEWPDVADAAERSARAAASCRRLIFTSADSFSPPEPALARGRIEGGSRGSGGSGGAGEDDVAVAVVGRGTGGVDFCGA